MARRPIPPIAWVVAGATALALLALTIPTLHAHGNATFYREGDATFYRATARDPFGTGAAFVRGGFGFEVAYRYGRIGLPFMAWLLALGRPALVPWTLVVVQLLAIAAIPGLAVVLADEYGAPPPAGVAVLLSPLLFARGIIAAEPTLIATILLAYVLEARQHHRSALVAFAYAIFVKETALLALIPWLWGALRARDVKRLAAYASAAIPYLAWCVVIRIRVGEFPFLVRTPSCTQAIGWPGAGIRQALTGHVPHQGSVIILVFATIAMCCAGAYAARSLPVGVFTGVLAIFFSCLGPNALRYSEETFRLVTLPLVFAMLCIAVAVGRRLVPRAAAQPPIRSNLNSASPTE